MRSSGSFELPPWLRRRAGVGTDALWSAVKQGLDEIQIVRLLSDAFPRQVFEFLRDAGPFCKHFEPHRTAMGIVLNWKERGGPVLAAFSELAVSPHLEN